MDQSTRTCAVEGCDGEARIRGWCQRHYDRWYRKGDPGGPFPPKKVGPDVCRVEGCDRLLIPPYGRGMCSLHYQRWRKHGDPFWVPRRGRSICVIDGCNQPIVGNGWCSKHYTRNLRYGSPTARIPGEVINNRKICPSCERDVCLEDYYSLESVYCKTCSRKRRREYRSAHPVPLKRDRKCVCIICGKHFMGNKKNSMTCSKSCRRENGRRLDIEATVKRRSALASVEVESISRLKVYERDEWICGLCGLPVDPRLRHPDPMSASLDHILPISLGGSHTWDNVQLAHLHCNCSKGNRVA